MCEYRLPFTVNITPLGISIAPLAQISIYINIPSSTVAATTVPAPRRSRPLFVTPKACHLSRYRESLPRKDFFKIGGRLVWMESTAVRRVFSSKTWQAERAKVGMDGEHRGTTSFFIQSSTEPSRERSVWMESTAARLTVLKTRQSRAGEVGVCGDYSVRIKNVIKEILYYGT